MELINLQFKNCHKPDYIINFMQDMVMQKIGLPLLRHPKHSLLLYKLMDAMELDKHLQIPMCSKLWWKITNLDNKLSESSETWC